MQRHTWLVTIFLVLAAFFARLVVPQVAVAQTASISAQANVTATVADNGPPTTPILIAPGNNTYVTISQPSFVWEASTDVNGISHYRLAIDGSTVYDNIPTSPTDNAQYTLTYDSMTSRYSLFPKTALSQGSHTWKVTAIDTTDNSSDSATWTFTIDTQAPSFVITQMGTETVSISAQDGSTIPSTPVELDANEPLLAGNGEANSHVQLTVTIPGDPSQNFTTTISSGGSWSIQLGILPRDVVITLDFVITDVAGNVTVLNGVQFTIPSEVIVIPPTSPSPTPTPTASASATPSSSPGASPEASPTAPGEPGFPSIEIPVIPPRELVNEVLQELGERLRTPFSVLTAPALAPLAPALDLAAEGFKAIAPYSAAVVSAALPAVATAALATQFGGSISPDLLIKIFQALGLIPSGKPQGLVFNSSNEEPIPFALITISSTRENTTSPQTVVTDDHGVYRGVRLPPGEYRLAVSQQEFLFPSQKARPAFMSYREFYKGEVFTVNNKDQEQLFLIPMDPLSQQAKSRWRNRLRLFLARLGRWTDTLIFPMFFISGLLAVLFPSWWNWVVSGVYALLLGRKVMVWFRVPILTGVVIDENGQPLDHVMIRLNESTSTELTELAVTDHKGEFALYGQRRKYQLAATKPDFVWYEGNSTMSLYEIDCSNGPQSIVIPMIPIASVASAP